VPAVSVTLSSESEGSSLALVPHDIASPRARSLSALRHPAGQAAATYELSPTSYPGLRAIPNLFRGGKVTSGLSSLRLAEGSSNGGDEVGTDMGKGGGIPDNGASDLPNERIGLGGGAGDNTCEGGDSGSDGDGIRGSGGEGTGAGIEILAVT
ncbi:hypothetical protein Tco_1230592, partial [Tanacetum coccineum]